MSDEIKNNTDTEIVDSVSVVGMNKGKKIVILSVVLLIAGIAYYFFIHKTDNTQDNNASKQAAEQEIEKLLKDSQLPTQETANKIDVPQKLPSLPPLVTPSLPTIPVIEKPKNNAPPIIEAPTILHLEPKKKSDIPLPPPIKQPSIINPISAFTGYDKERRVTPMLVTSGSDQSENKDNKQNQQFNNNSILNFTSAPNSIATRVANLNYTILQGKIIDAVLETAINSDLPGTLRAIISRDVYSDANNIIIIPKGSRLIGSYSFDESQSNTRVNIIWSRVILPHGIDIQIDSPGTDELGRQGVSGFIDQKITNILTSTLLIAGVSFGTAIATSKMPALSNSIITTTPPAPAGSLLPTTSTSTTLPVKILSQAIEEVSESIKGILKKYADVKPTIYVDQGTLLKVFINKDLVFPKEAIIGTNIVK
ncbi:TrbI/VirB10 family protein [Candidatus Neoehrlichia lotoris]